MANATTEAEGASPLREEIERLRHEVDSLVNRFKEARAGLAPKRMKGCASTPAKRAKAPKMAHK